MKKLMIYPFDIESITIIRHKSLLTDYEITALVSPKGWGMDGYDASIVDNADKLSINIDADFEKSLEKVDAVFFAESSIKLNFKEVLYPKFLEAVKNNKDIICAVKLDDEYKKEFESLCCETNIEFKYVRGSEDFDYLMKNSEDMLYEINSPVVYICGNDERTDKYEIELSLRQSILKDGYTISQISSRDYSFINEVHPFPGFMNENYISEKDKIILFNHYIKSIEVNENPDLIVIGIPGGMSPFDSRFTNNFGIRMYETANAVKPDYVIFSNTYRAYSLEDFKELCTVSKYRFGFEIDCFNISNTRIDWNTSIEMSKKVYTKISPQLVDEDISALNNNIKPVINILNADGAHFLYEHMINSLSDNSVVTWI